MTTKIQKIIDRTQEGDGSANQIGEGVKSASSALSKLSRELPDNALKNAYVGKMLLNRIDEYEKEVVELRTYRTQFHEADKKAATLQERLDISEGSVGVRAAISTLGGITTGSLFSLWVYPSFFWGMIMVSLVLFFIAYLAPLLIKLLKNKLK